MTLFLDSSAIVAAHVDGPAREALAPALDGDVWCASGLALAESLALVDRLTDEQILRVDLEDAIRSMWDRVHVVPVDEACLDAAARLAREQPLGISNAIHLAAAARLPRPVRFATFAPEQIMVALSMGFDVVSA